LAHAYDWTYDESYHYGWLVLPLTLYLFSVRWRDRPAPEPDEPQLTAGWVVLALVLPLAWLVREPNPEWRLLSIVLAGVAVAAATLYLANAGGRRWSRHFAGAVLFFLASVPWPSIIERLITTSLMPLNASIAMEALRWMNVPAVRSGNLISIAGGTLGVEEACSGIRSLQTTVVTAWFVGELNHLRWRARLGLVAAGVLAAFLTNVGRTVGLSALAVRSGLDTANSWHDAVGLTATAINIAVILFAGSRIMRATPRPAAVAVPTRAIAALTASVPVRGPAILAAGLALMIPLTEWWYGRREVAASPGWHLALPSSATEFAELPIDDRTKLMLRYSKAWSARWKSNSGHPVRGFFIEWNAGRIPPENMNVHQPGGCLGSLGIEFVEELAPVSVPIGGVIQNVRLLRFNDRSRPLHVLYFVDEVSRPPDGRTQPFDFEYERRWDYVLKARRNTGQRFLEIGLWDQPSEAAVRSEFLAMLDEWVRDGDW
jgi:exosortase